MDNPNRTRTEFLENHLQPATDTSSRDSGHCPICFQELEPNSPVITPCRHVYCSECAQTWFRSSNTCPDCRRELFDATTIPHTFDMLDLNLEIDGDALEAAMVRYDNLARTDGFEVGPIDMILVDHDAILVDAIAAANVLKPYKGGRLNDADILQGEWEHACYIVDDFLREREHQELPADYFDTLLSQALFDGLVWNTSNERWPEYGHGVFPEGLPPDAVSFEYDIDTIVAYATYSARGARVTRQLIGNTG